MIDVKQAVKKAAEQLVVVLTDRPIANVEVEEIERTDDERYWLVTMGYTDNPIDSVISSIARDGRNRRYKVLKIDAATGEFVSMKMREPLVR